MKPCGLAFAAPGGVIGLIPNRVHGGIEAVVGVSLLAGPWLAGDTFSSAGRIFFAAIGVTLLVLWTVSDYSNVPDSAAA